MRIYDATNGSKGVKVDETNSLKTRSVSKGPVNEATVNGDAFNINTSDVTITQDSAILYFRNGENRDFFVDDLFVGVGQGDVNDIQKIFVVKNPSAGTIVTNAVPVTLNQNRNFGSPLALNASTIYKGVDGDTFTDGIGIATIYVSAGSRLFTAPGFLLPRGTSIGIVIETALNTGSLKVYAAVTGHLRVDE